MKFPKINSLQALLPQLRTVGDANIYVAGLGHTGDIFVGMLSFAENTTLLHKLVELGAAAVIVRQSDVTEFEARARFTTGSSTTLCIADNPSAEFAQLLISIADNFDSSPENAKPEIERHDVEISQYAHVAKDAVIGTGSVISAGVQIESSVCIGEGCVVRPNAVIGHGSRIGNNSNVGESTAIGSQPNWYYERAGRRIDFTAIGHVEIGSDVTIGSGCSIDRGLTGVTRIEDGCKFGNLVQIGHEATVGKNVLVVAQVGIAGNCKIEEGARILGQAGVDRNVTVGKNSQVAAGSSVTKDVQPNTEVIGFRAVQTESFVKLNAAVKRLPRHYLNYPVPMIEWQTIFDEQDEDAGEIVRQAIQPKWCEAFFRAVVDEIVIDLGLEESSRSNIKPEDFLIEDLKVDSLDVVELQTSLEDRFEIIFHEKDWNLIETVSDCTAISASLRCQPYLRRVTSNRSKETFVNILKSLQEARHATSRLQDLATIQRDLERVMYFPPVSRTASATSNTRTQ